MTLAILRKIGATPGEKSVMHFHPDSVAVFMADQKAKMTYPNRKSEEMSPKKGDAVFMKAGKHLLEDIGLGNRMHNHRRDK